MSGKRQAKPKSKIRRNLTYGGFALLLLYAIHAAIGNWFVHHSSKWIRGKAQEWPAFVVDSLLFTGNPCADFTDSLNFTGHDAVYEYDIEPPSGSVLFAGEPRRTGPIAPGDITTLNRGEFVIGWSDQLRHPVWCAYHVPAEKKYEQSRKGFKQDRSVASAPKPNDYKGSGFDRGHMAPNYAIVTRFGEEMQSRTFLMSNVAPQTPSLNRGPWREIEHRIAELWTHRYGEIWVLVGCIKSSVDEKLNGTDIDVPEACWQLIVAQEGMNVRAMAILMPQDISYSAYPARHLITIDELEELTGLDFLPELPEFIQSPLEAELPTRLWPIRPLDIFNQFKIRYAYY